MSTELDPILRVRDLRTSFFTDRGEVRAVDGVSFDVPRGSTVCVVGESGSGKTAMARSVLQVVDRPGRVVSGSIDYRAEAEAAPADLAGMDPRGQAIRRIRGKEISMIFQEPMSSLSPVHTVGRQILELLTEHEGLKRRDPAARERVIDALRGVGIPRAEERIDAYTFQLSGGMRQRAMIAMALITNPRLVIADEPTTALDVTTQAQILDLLAELKESADLSLMFITHDLGVVAEIADRVVVMRHGKVVESGPVDQIFHDPRHDYTKELLSSLPQRGDRGNGRAVITPRRAPAAAEVRPLLEVDRLSMEFTTSAGRRLGPRRKTVVKAVDGVSFQVRPGQTLGIVGESGCGKTTLGRTLLRAYRPSSGAIRYRAEPDAAVVDLAGLGERELLPYRRQLRMIFQDPYSSLNPRMTVQQVVAEPLHAAGETRRDVLRDRAAEALRRVGLRPDMLNRYPHAFSGGERQRIGIARALITGPKLVVADEAVSALDVSVRTQVLELLAELQRELGLTYVFVSHDLSVVERVCDEVAVMYFGKIVEHGPASAIFADPQHDYTKALLSAVPIADPDERGSRQRIEYRPEPVG
ncbi:ABC transporter ATP-binding protein [Microlunatus parietis]|uniref:Peptide/nickel transport system ATP-binding protein n=1 Tax=Microlunatus parietis TaxID=682979 RepID=A0A7Y9I5N8_9ACTN|nr:ABC transporter ATP-binding protein [Microlunatus parietis]NYE70480.1 peptide/nickel transport system ATP-binding protein [Microlunatus parietis]